MKGNAIFKSALFAVRAAVFNTQDVYDMLLNDIQNVWAMWHAQ
jgi:hypothetical protein